MDMVMLNDGGHMPNFGFGTWHLNDGREAESAVTAALETGYRLIDTAKIYGNETGVGRAIKQSGLARQEIFLTTKLWPNDFGHVRRAMQESLDRLGLDYLDLYLLHWPGHDSDLRRQAWRELEKTQADGLVKHIGVSNYMPEHLAEMAGYAKVPPAVNQIEFHPFIYKEQSPALAFSHKNKIIVEAYSPLAQARNLKNPLLEKLADKHSKTPAQVMLRWAIQHKTVPIPKSANQERIKQNFDVFDFKLDHEEMGQIDRLSAGRGAFG
jgi:diketogulonate reductase-like aldo/keto reductase